MNRIEVAGYLRVVAPQLRGKLPAHLPRERGAVDGKLREPLAARRHAAPQIDTVAVPDRFSAAIEPRLQRERLALVMLQQRPALDFHAQRGAGGERLAQLQRVREMDE